ADRVLDQLQDRLAAVRVEHVAHLQPDSVVRRARAYHVQPLGAVVEVERHQVPDLLAVQVRDRDQLPGARLDRAAVVALDHHLAWSGCAAHRGLRTVTRTGVIRCWFTGLRSIGQEETAPTRSCSARKTMESPAFETAGRRSKRPSAFSGVFWKMSIGAGICHQAIPYGARASLRLSRQLRWYP